MVGQRRCQKCGEYKNSLQHFKIYNSGIRSNRCKECVEKSKNRDLTCNFCSEKYPKSHYTKSESGRYYRKCRTCKSKKVVRKNAKQRNKTKKDDRIDRSEIRFEAKKIQQKTALELKAENDKREAELTKQNKLVKIKRFDRFGKEYFIIRELT